ncbi:hypothetical protein Scep_022051 [Stephania cephalantha]|uniref:Uncharacterized protein n=1 Tax=Stephania cephalantha TaxID=152367 RepID=A0AAP0I0P2_9MAGN
MAAIAQWSRWWSTRVGGQEQVAQTARERRKTARTADGGTARAAAMAGSIWRARRAMASDAAAPATQRAAWRGVASWRRMAHGADDARNWQAGSQQASRRGSFSGDAAARARQRSTNINLFPTIVGKDFGATPTPLELFLHIHTRDHDRHTFADQRAELVAQYFPQTVDITSAAAPTSGQLPPPSSLQPPLVSTSTPMAPLSAPPLASTHDLGDKNESSHSDELDD